MSSLSTLGAGPSAGDPYAAYLVYASFTAANGTTLPNYTPEKDTVGNGFVDVVAGITIENNKASDNQADRRSVIDAGNADVIIKSNVIINGGNFFGVIFRYQDATHFFIAGCDILLNDTTIWINNGGAWSKLANPDHTYTNGDSVQITVRLSGTSIEVDIDDVNEISITNSNFQTETEHGLYVDGNSWSADGTWDNFSIS